MPCMTGFFWGKLGKEAHKQRLTGKRTTLQERKTTLVSCGKCDMTMSSSSLQHHVEIIHRRILDQTQEVNTGVGGRDTYKVSFTQVLTLVACLVEG